MVSVFLSISGLRAAPGEATWVIWPEFPTWWSRTWRKDQYRPRSLTSSKVVIYYNSPDLRWVDISGKSVKMNISAFAELPEDCRGRWESFVDETLRETNRRNTVELVRCRLVALRFSRINSLLLTSSPFLFLSLSLLVIMTGPSSPGQCQSSRHQLLTKSDFLSDICYLINLKKE